MAPFSSWGPGAPFPVLSPTSNVDRRTEKDPTCPTIANGPKILSMKEHQKALRELSRRSAQQHALLTRADVHAAGMTDRQISGRLRSGAWVPVFAGVYRMAAAPVTPEQRTLAAVLACGPGAFASHRSAAWLWELQDRPPERPAVSVARGSHPRPVGVELHRVRRVAADRLHERRQIWCTDPLHTLVDLASLVTDRELRDAVDRGLASRLVTVAALDAELRRQSAKGRKGIGALRAHLRRGFVGAPPPSMLESRTLRLLASAGIHPIAVECPTGDGWYRLDIQITGAVAVEVSGYRYHWSPEQLSADETRRNRIALSGVLVLTYTWWDISRDSARVVREIRQALARAAA